MKGLRLAGKTIKILVKDRIHYPGRLLIDTFSMISRYGVVVILYWYVFKLRGGLIDGATFVPVAWSMFFYFSFMVFRLRDISRSIMEDVRTGSVELLFNRPISYLSYKIWWQVGSGIYSFLIMAILGAVVLYLTVGTAATMNSVAFLLTLILVFVLCCVLSLVIYMAVGLLAFWIEDINPVFWIVDKFVMILGGSYLPIALFPDFLSKLSVYSPFGASQLITHATQNDWLTIWPTLIGIQVFWVVVFALLVVVVFGQAKKRLSVNGG